MSDKPLTEEEIQQQIHTFKPDKLYPQRSILKSVESQIESSEPLTPRAKSGVKRANDQLGESLSRMNSISEYPTKAEIFLKDRSTSTFKKNIKSRRALLTQMAAQIRRENETPSTKRTKLSFNDVVLSHEIPPDFNTFKSVSQQDEEQAKYKKWKTVDDVSTYLANELYNEEFSKETIFDLLNYCDDRKAGASAVAAFASVSTPAQYAKSADMCAIVRDPAAAFTEANLLYLKKNGLLEYTLQKTVEKIEAKEGSIYGKAAYALQTIRDYIWTAFMAIVKLNEREPDEFEVYEKKLGGGETGGRRTRRNKRNKRSRKSIKRRSSKKTKRRNSSRRNSSR